MGNTWVCRVTGVLIAENASTNQGNPSSSKSTFCVLFTFVEARARFEVGPLDGMIKQILGSSIIWKQSLGLVHGCVGVRAVPAGLSAFSGLSAEPSWTPSRGLPSVFTGELA